MLNSKYYILFVIIILFSACDGEIYTRSDKSNYVVEGIIESDGNVSMYITKSMDVINAYQEYESAAETKVVREAKVCVSLEDSVYTVSGKESKETLIPYLYSTNVGKNLVGKRCKVNIELDGSNYVANTYIPEGHNIDSVYSEYIDPNKYLLHVIVKDVKHDEYGRLFLKTEGQYESYLLVPQGKVSSENALMSTLDIVVSRPSVQYDTKKHTMYFKKGETVTLKLSMMDKVGYDFWNSFEERLYLSRNPFFPLTTNLSGSFSNVKGYWIGYNSSYVTFTI